MIYATLQNTFYFYSRDIFHLNSEGINANIISGRYIRSIVFFADSGTIPAFETTDTNRIFCYAFLMLFLDWFSITGRLQSLMEGQIIRIERM